MEQKKNDSCSIQKSSFRKLKTLFYFHYTLVGAVHSFIYTLFILVLIYLDILKFPEEFMNKLL